MIHPITGATSRVWDVDTTDEEQEVWGGVQVLAPDSSEESSNVQEEARSDQQEESANVGKKTGRFCKGKRDRIRRIVDELVASIREDPASFDEHTFAWPLSMANNPDSKLLVMKILRRGLDQDPEEICHPSAKQPAKDVAAAASKKRCRPCKLKRERLKAQAAVLDPVSSQPLMPVSEPVAIDPASPDEVVGADPVWLPLPSFLKKELPVRVALRDSLELHGRMPQSDSAAQALQSEWLSHSRHHRISDAAKAKISSARLGFSAAAQDGVFSF